MSIRVTKWRIFAVVVVAVLLLDQLSKAWVLSNMTLYESHPLIEPVLYLTRSENTGIAFGIGGEFASPVFVLLAIGITLLVTYLYWGLPKDVYLQHVGLSMAVGGGIGNVLDRLQHGVVIDFVHIIIPGVLSNVSNFADHALVLGVIILLLDSLRPERPKPVPVIEESQGAQPMATPPVQPDV